MFIVILRLGKYIKGQPRAVSAIVNAVKAWEYSSSAKTPLILLFSGDTGTMHCELHSVITKNFKCIQKGTGKSETAYRMAEIILKKKTRGHKPRGLLVVRGEEYSSQSTGKPAASTARCA